MLGFFLNGLYKRIYIHYEIYIFCRKENKLGFDLKVNAQTQSHTSGRR
jgi:hypothetical protein